MFFLKKKHFYLIGFDCDRCCYQRGGHKDVRKKSKNNTGSYRLIPPTGVRPLQLVITTEFC